MPTTLPPAEARRLPAALLVYLVWVGLTVFGMRWASDGAPRPLVETVSHGIS